MASSARIDELLKKFEENPRRYFAPLANEYRKAGDLEQAIFICQEYLPQQPGHMSGHIVYGQALYELNRHEEAKAVFETALSLDPENLIALRHLGDIARQAGDTQNARMWYQRVLEADPRNEEIAQLMLSLLTPDASAPQTQAEPVSATAPTPITTPAVPPIPVVPPAPPTSDAAESSSPLAHHGGFEVEKSPDEAIATPAMAAAAVEPPPVPPPAPAAPPPQAATSSRNAPKEEELLDLDDFDLGGVPLAELRNEEAAEPTAESAAPEAVAESDLGFPSLVDQDEATPPPVPPAAAVAAEPASEPVADELDLDAVFEADPFAIASNPERAAAEPAAPDDVLPEPAVERATDLRLGLVDDGSVDTTEAESTSASMDGLETFEAGVFAAPALEGAAIATESFFDTPASGADIDVGEPFDEPFVEGGIESVAPESAEAQSAVPAEAFVTETMAELYLQQGHLDSALDIYRKIVSQRPDDVGLAERMQLVEDRVMGRVPSAAAESAESSEPWGSALADDEAPVAAQPRSFGGPTIREFLSGLARRAPGGGGAVAEADAYSEELAAPEPYSVPSESIDVDVPHTADEFAAAANAAGPTPASNETVGESLGALFSGADAAASDTAAANTLAEAFAPEGPETAPLQGVPAHRASSELSLDHVFKGNTAPRANVEREGFSFDQFFSDEAAERPAESTGPGVGESTPAEPQRADDIAQFNAWLNGLKKT